MPAGWEPHLDFESVSQLRGTSGLLKVPAGVGQQPYLGFFFKNANMTTIISGFFFFFLNVSRTTTISGFFFLNASRTTTISEIFFF